MMVKNGPGTNRVQQAREAGFKVKKLAIHSEREPMNPAHDALGSRQLVEVKSPCMKGHLDFRAGR